jgi:hypothetical protein
MVNRDTIRRPIPKDGNPRRLVKPGVSLIAKAHTIYNLIIFVSSLQRVPLKYLVHGKGSLQGEAIIFNLWTQDFSVQEACPVKAKWAMKMLGKQ